MVREKLKNIGNEARHTYKAQYGGVGIKKVMVNIIYLRCCLKILSMMDI